MNISTDFAKASIALSTASIQQQASLSITKKAMDSQEQQAASLISQMLTVNPPGLGENIDVRG